MSYEAEFRQRAEDLAEWSDHTVEEAAAMMLEALRVDAPPISVVRKLPRYMRWTPLRWKQLWLLRHLERLGQE